jgi:hypothetical protein
MEAISGTEIEKPYRRVFANDIVELVLKIHHGKLPNPKYVFSLLYLPSGDASVSMSVKKICTFALYKPEVTIVNIQAGIWCTMWGKDPDAASKTVCIPPSPYLSYSDVRHILATLTPLRRAATHTVWSLTLMYSHHLPPFERFSDAID